MRKILMIMAFGVLFMACHRRDLFYENKQYVNLYLEVDWSVAFPSENTKPQGMSVWFYPVDGGEPIMKSTNDVDKYRVKIPEGIYDILIFNQTPRELSGSLSFRDVEALGIAEVYSILMANKSWYEQETNKHVNIQPEYFAAAVYENVEVLAPINDLGYTTEHEDEMPVVNQTIKATPLMLTKDVEILVYVKNAASISDVRSVVSGFAEGHTLNGEYQNGENSINIIDNWSMHGDNDEAVIVFYLTSFGYKMCTDDFDENNDYWNGELDLRVMLHNGEIESIILPLDKTNIIETGDKLKMKLEVALGNPVVLPDVPDPGNGDLGFNPDVSEWPEEDIVLPI